MKELTPQEHRDNIRKMFDEKASPPERRYNLTYEQVPLTYYERFRLAYLIFTGGTKEVFKATWQACASVEHGLAGLARALVALGLT